MPVVRGYSKMLRRNLLYTGITRAKNFLILCGEPDVLASGLAKTDDLARQTSLKARLNPMAANEQIEVKVTDTEKPQLKKEVEKPKQPEQVHEQLALLNVSQSHKIGETLPNNLTTETAPYIHPLIGMEGISPYDFINK